MSTDQAPCAPSQVCTCADCPRAALQQMRSSSFWLYFEDAMKTSTNQELDDFTAMLQKIERADPCAFIGLLRDIAELELKNRGQGSLLLQQLSRQPHPFSELAGDPPHQS